MVAFDGGVLPLVACDRTSQTPLFVEYKSVQEAVDALRSLVEGVTDTQGALSDPTIDELQVRGCWSA